MKLKWDKIIHTIMFFKGAVVRAETVYLPRTFCLLFFISVVMYLIFR